MRSLVALHRLSTARAGEKWFPDTLRLMRHLDPDFRIIESCADGPFGPTPFLTVPTETAVGKYICPALPSHPHTNAQKQRWWTPTSSADALFSKTKKFARAQAHKMVKPKIEAYWATARQEVFQQCDHESPRFYFAGIVLKYSPFSLDEIMGAPKLRLHRQALARMLTGDMMIGGITRHYFLPTADRVPGLPTGCVTCYKSSGAIALLEWAFRSFGFPRSGQLGGWGYSCTGTDKTVF